MFTDTIVKSRQRLNQRMLEWIPDSSKADLVLLVSHFPSTFALLQKEMETVDYQVETGALDRSWLKHTLSQLQHQKRHAEQESTQVVLCLSQQLISNGLDEHDVEQWMQSIAGEPRLRVAILIAERHFLRARDQQVMDYFVGCGADRQIGFFVAMDDPVVKVFGNAALSLLLEHYGMTDYSAVESALVSKQIRHAQGRFAKMSSGDSFVSSPEQWLQTHCPTALKK